MAREREREGRGAVKGKKQREKINVFYSLCQVKQIEAKKNEEQQQFIYNRGFCRTIKTGLMNFKHRTVNV